MQTTSRNAFSVAKWLPVACTTVAFILSLGFLLHTSPDPTILGKYNLGYAVFLLLLFVVVLPAFHRLARFCVVSHTLKSATGRQFVLGPRHKLAALALLVGFVCLIANVLFDHLLNREALGFNPNVFHPYLQNVPRPNDPALHVNRWGFRGDEIELAKGPDVFRVFVFGGSTVYCGTVPFEQTHCRVLERRLRAAYPQYRIEVQNLGAEWHTTEHDTIKLLFLAQDFSPDLVITFHAINDLVRSLSPDLFGEGSYWPDYRQYRGAVANLASHGSKTSSLVTTAVGHWCSDLRFDQMRLEGPEGNGLRGMRTLFYPKAVEVDIRDWKSQPAFERNLRDFVTIAQGKAMLVMLATQASLYRDDLTPVERQLLGFPLSHHFDGKRPSLRSMIDGMQRFNDVTRRLAAETGVVFVDLERQMPKTTEYLYDDVHYTKAGNELIGNAFAECILQSRMVERVMEARAQGKNYSPSPKDPQPLTAARRSVTAK